MAEEIEKFVEGAENVENVKADSSTLRKNDNPIVPGTMLEPMSNKESLKEEISAVKQFINVIEEEEESVEDDYELRIREKGKHVEESRRHHAPQQLDLLGHIVLSDQDDPHDDAHPKGENSKKRQKTSEHGTFMFRESSSGQDYESKPGHEHKFITEIVARRANGSIVSITESDYNKLNTNDIEDMYLLIVNNKVEDYVETSLLWSLSVFIICTVIWEIVHDFKLGLESYQ
nr:hypothetical protein [Tanacetum cinerariifolium]